MDTNPTPKRERNREILASPGLSLNQKAIHMVRSSMEELNRAISVFARRFKAEMQERNAAANLLIDDMTAEGIPVTVDNVKHIAFAQGAIIEASKRRLEQKIEDAEWKRMTGGLGLDGDEEELTLDGDEEPIGALPGDADVRAQIAAEQAAQTELVNKVGMQFRTPSGEFETRFPESGK